MRDDPERSPGPDLRGRSLVGHGRHREIPGIRQGPLSARHPHCLSDRRGPGRRPATAAAHHPQAGMGAQPRPVALDHARRGRHRRRCVPSPDQSFVLFLDGSPPSSRYETNPTETTKGPSVWMGPLRKYGRLRPTLPHRHQCSTIGAEGLSFRVRNGAGRFPFAMTAETLWRYQSVPDHTSGTAQWTREI